MPASLKYEGGGPSPSYLASALLGGFLLLGPLGGVPWLVLDEQAALLSLGALVRQVEELDDGGDVVVDAKLLEHPHVRDSSLEGRNDLCVGGIGNLVAHLAEAMDVLADGLARLLAHGAKVVVLEATLVRALEVRHEAPGTATRAAPTSSVRRLSQAS